MQHPETARDRLVVALDMDGHEALALAHSLQDAVRWVKVGMTLFYSEGPIIVERLRTMGFDVFVDLKLHDIPHQVESAARALGRLGAGMLTVHASGGSAMVDAAVRGARMGAKEAGLEPPAVLGVTVLTSMNDDALGALGLTDGTEAQVVRLARVAKAGRAAGIVCSSREAAMVRELLNGEPLVVTPGIRPTWSEKGDQQRIETPEKALAAGASHLVVGRPITTAAVPLQAVEMIVSEMEGATPWVSS